MISHEQTPTRFTRERCRPHFVRHIGLGILFGVVLLSVLSYAVMMLWNAVMPVLLGVGHISFWRSAGLLILSRILVGGFHRPGFGRHRMGGPRAWREYEQWWREVGEQSYRDYSASRGTAAPQSGEGR